ncbi:MAG: response regulator [Candidatus Magnetomorum sp.]|nr:response regulator [Candidatus Magnetomorum sp.]
MLQGIPKVRIKDSIATKLLKSVFGVYVMIAVVVTMIHIVVEYYHTRNAIIRELKVIHQTIEDALALSLWDFDLTKTQSIINGGVILPSVKGIRIEDETGKTVGIAGDVYEQQNVMSKPGGLKDYFKWDAHQVYGFTQNIYYYVDTKKVRIGRISLFSDRSVVLERVRVGFVFLIVNSLIKSLALWIIFLLYSRKFIQRPLYILTSATTQIDLDNLEHFTIDINIPGHNEFKVLESSFKQMTEKLLESRTRLQKLNASLNAYKNHLEVMVDERTKELTSSNTRLESEIDNHKRTQEALYQAKEDAEMASQFKSEFLANMSHEIRTPMNAILGLTHLVLQTELNSKQHDFLNKINTSAGPLLRIINDILDFSKIEAGKLEIENISFNLDAVLDNLSNIITFKAEEKGLEVLFNIEPAVPRWLIGDPLRIEQILSNLFSNALKFTSQGEILLTATVIKKEKSRVIVQFSVKDSGIGMTKKELNKLFQAFTQADGSTTRKYGGTGLGLSICKNLVNLMGGEIRVTSQPGVGSTFLFTLPFGIDQEQIYKSVLMANQFKEKRCLIVDDNDISRMIFTQNLESFSLQCKAVSSGKKAIEVLKNTDEPYDLVLLDWKMPEMDGIETAQRIIEHHAIIKKPKILMVSAYGREEVRHRAKEAGFDSFLLKPVNRSVLFNAIVDIIGDKTQGILYKKAALQKDKSNEVLNNIRGAHILVVEDNIINQEIVNELLKENGFIVSIANNGYEAIAAIEKNTYDLVFMDIQMPELDGLDATRCIREKGFNDLPIIAMTAHAMTGDREKSIKAGMNDHITKPLDPAKLYETLIRWIPERDQSDQCFPSETLPKDQKPCIAFPDEIPGISIETGLSRSNNNQALYLRLLKKFHQCYTRKDLETLKIWIRNNETDQSAQWVHTLKGVSGNIGAEDLQKATTAFETSIKTDTDSLKKTLETFSKTYLDLLDALEKLPFFDEHLSDSSQKKQIEPQKLKSMLNELIDFISKRKPKPCIQMIEDLNNYELPEAIVQDIKALNVLLKRYRFKEASEKMAGIIDKI